jgi:hypothetical protein
MTLCDFVRVDITCTNFVHGHTTIQTTVPGSYCDDSLSKLRELLQQVGGSPEPTVQGLVACILKFQGVKRSLSGAAIILC